MVVEGMTIRDGETFEPISTIALPSMSVEDRNGAALVFSPEKSVLLTNIHGSGRLFDVATGEQIGVPFPDDIGNSGVNWGEVPQLATVNEYAILLWNLDMSTWPDIACSFARSNMTHLEWERWGPRDEA
ncbi:MAG: hypothetical protein GY925_24500 [Actinomycetia bacterium]|nr:hypothetical protein [Actinomycetes bacterium]